MDKKTKYAEKYIRIGLNIAYYRKLRGIVWAHTVHPHKDAVSNFEDCYKKFSPPVAQSPATFPIFQIILREDKPPR